MPIGVARAVVTRASSQAAAAFAKDGAPSFSTISGTTSAKDHTHTFGANSDAFTIIFGGEVGTALTITSVVIDPAGSNIPCASLVSASESIARMWAYEAHGFSGVSGAKTVRITWGSGAAGDAGRVQAQSYTGAADAAPTPTDSGSAATGTSLALSLTAPDADGILQWGISVGNDQAITPSGFTETNETNSGGGAGWTVQYGEQVGALTSPEAASASWGTSNRSAAVAFVVNPAGEAPPPPPPEELTEESSTLVQYNVSGTPRDATIDIPTGTGRVLLDFLGFSNVGTDTDTLDPAGVNTALAEVTGSPQAFGAEDMVCFHLLEASFPVSATGTTLRWTDGAGHRGRRRVVVLSGASQTIFSAGNNLDGGALTVTVTRPTGTFATGSKIYAAMYGEASAGNTFTVTGNVTEVDDEGVTTDNDRWVFAAGTLASPAASVSATFTRDAGGVTRKQAIIVVVEPA